MGQSTVAICCLLSDNDDPSNIPLFRTAQVSRYQEKPFIPLQTGRSKTFHYIIHAFSSSLCQYTHIHTCLTALCLGVPGWAGTRKVKPIWILLKQETVSGSGISWDICKSAPRSRQITMPAPHHSVFLQARCPPCRPTNSVKALKALSVHTTCQLFWCITSIISSIPNLPLNSLHEPICYYNTTHLPNTILISACWSANSFSCQVSLHFCLRVTQ